MKNKHILYLIMMPTIMMLGTSCYKDYLSPTPTTSISDASAFSTSDRVVSQVRSLYASLRSGQFYGGRYQIYNDVRGEDFINEQTNGVTALEVWNFSVGNSNSQVQNLWSQAYYVINLCNVFLDGMTAKGNAVVGTALAANYNAEAKFIRALSYYSLLQLYAFSWQYRFWRLLIGKKYSSGSIHANFSRFKCCRSCTSFNLFYSN
jgi:hypothetical protein